MLKDDDIGAYEICNLQCIETGDIKDISLQLDLKRYI